MVKIHDGSLVPASELLSNNAEDDEGEKLKFEQVKDATYPTFEAKSKVHDDSGRERTYRFSFDDTNVTVHMTTSESDEEKKAKEEEANKKTEKSTKEVSASTESKKNSSSNSEQQQEKLSPPDYRLRNRSLT
jgi:DNA polymerase III alpha subunit (gram-positive type)